jgi:hypothetical protein
MHGKFYVYALIDPRKGKNGQVFYIGKGKGNRSQMHIYNSTTRHRKNPKLYNKIRKILNSGSNYKVEFLFSSNDELICLEKEMQWITFYGLSTLCNLTNGGEGTSGLSRPDLIAYNKTRVFSQETRAKISLSNTGKTKGVKQSEDHKKKRSDALKRLIVVDGISGGITETCQRVGVDTHLLRKWIKSGFSPQEIVDRFRSLEGNLRSRSLFPSFKEENKNTHPNAKLVCIDGITDLIPSTCNRLNIHLSTFRKWLNRGIDAQAIADKMRSREITGLKSLFPSMSRSIKKAGKRAIVPN